MARFEADILVLQERVGAALEGMDGVRFETQEWQRPAGGGGRMGFLRGHRVEKAACHVSRVWGDQNPLTGRPFRAAGLSLILHPRSPHAPSVHLNVRRFEEQEQAWWGGGIDLTPLGIHHDEDVAYFHDALQQGLGRRYEAGRRAAEDYFLLPHRGRARGAGGVFYDHLSDLDVEGERRFVMSVAERFFDAYLPILRRRADAEWTEDERRRQCEERGLYVEFNLLYDRGTRFGLESGGNVEAILSSLPPEVHWP